MATWRREGLDGLSLGIVTHNIIEGDGQGRVNVALVRYLVQQGIKVTLIANRVSDSLQEEAHEVIHIETGVVGEKVDLIKVWRFKRKADQVLRQRRQEFDAVIACGVTCSVPHTINAVHFAHGGWLRSPYHAWKVNPGLNGAYQWLFSRLNDRWERHTLSNAERIVAVSEMVRDELEASGIPASKIDVVVNGVDATVFRPGNADRKELHLPPNVPLGLFVGDIRSPIKNPDGCLRALQEAPETHLAFVGALEGSPLPRLARELGLQDRVHFLGFRRDIPDLMRAADFFLLPSRRDSCPLVLLEAMASGLPCVVSSNVGTHALVERGAGFVIDAPDDLEGLSESLRTLSSDGKRRERMGAIARRVAEEHTWERMSQRYLEIIKETLVADRAVADH